MASRSDNRVPLRRWQLWRFLWLIWAGAAITALVSVALLVLRVVETPAHPSFPGVLRPVRQVSEVYLPPGAMLDTLLVEPGQTVSVGETVALLDTRLMEAALADIERDIEATNWLRDCLFQNAAPPDSPASAPSGDEELQRLLSRANEECRAVYAPHLLELRRIEAGLLRLDTELALLSRQSVRRTTAVDLAEDTAFRLALRRTQTQQMKTRLEIALSARQSALAEDRLAQTQELETEVRVLHQNRDRVLRHIETPRLTAAVSGRVIRVRPPASGSALPQPVSVLRIQRADNPAFESWFDAPSYLAETMRVGDPVAIDLYDVNGLPVRSVGSILAITALSGGRGTGERYQVRVAVADGPASDPAPLAHLATLESGRTLNVHLATAPASLSAALVAALNDAIANTGTQPWWQALAAIAKPGSHPS